jgi:hypothetical protein
MVGYITSMHDLCNAWSHQTCPPLSFYAPLPYVTVSCSYNYTNTTALNELGLQPDKTVKVR